MLTLKQYSDIKDLADQKHQAEWRDHFKSDPPDLFSTASLWVLPPAVIRYVLEAAIELGIVQVKDGE